MDSDLCSKCLKNSRQEWENVQDREVGGRDTYTGWFILNVYYQDVRSHFGAIQSQGPRSFLPHDPSMDRCDRGIMKLIGYEKNSIREARTPQSREIMLDTIR